MGWVNVVVSSLKNKLEETMLSEKLPYPVMSNCTCSDELLRGDFRADMVGMGFCNKSDVGDTVNGMLDQLGDGRGISSSLAYYREAYPSRRDPDKEDILEIAKAGKDLEVGARPLSIGQKVFHGGDWPRDSDGNYVRSFATDRLLSTSLCLNIAIAHVDDQTLGARSPDVWVIEVKSSNHSSGAMVFPYVGEMKHELEVVIRAGVSVIMDRWEKVGRVNYIFCSLC